MLVNRERKKNQRKKKAKHTSKQRKNKIKEKWKREKRRHWRWKSNVSKYFWKFILWAFSYQFFLNFRKKILRSYHLFFFILIQPNTLPKQNKKKKILIFSPKFSLHHVSPLNKHTPKSWLEFDPCLIFYYYLLFFYVLHEAIAINSLFCWGFWDSELIK